VAGRRVGSTPPSMLFAALTQHPYLIRYRTLTLLSLPREMCASGRHALLVLQLILVLNTRGAKARLMNLCGCCRKAASHDAE